MIEIKNVVKTYIKGKNPLTAVNGVSFNIADGEFVAIVGKSGCGKSTLLNLIGGLDDLTSGSISYNGVEVGEMNSKERSNYRNKEIGFVFQSYNLEPHFNVGMNVSVPLIVANAKKAEREKMTKEALNKMGLSDRYKSEPSELSGGEAQRVAIARAIINNPKVVLADEPTGNLDTINGTLIMEYLTAINKKGTTIILVTHNPAQCDYCDRVIEMEDGRIISDRKQCVATANSIEDVQTMSFDNNNSNEEIEEKSNINIISVDNDNAEIDECSAMQRECMITVDEAKEGSLC